MKLPFKPTNPRSINGAMQRGWHVVTLTDSYRTKHNVSYIGLVNWVARESRSYFVKEFVPGRGVAFAFEDAVDAFWFESRFG